MIAVECQTWLFSGVLFSLFLVFFFWGGGGSWCLDRGSDRHRDGGGDRCGCVLLTEPMEFPSKGGRPFGASFARFRLFRLQVTHVAAGRICSLLCVCFTGAGEQRGSVFVLPQLHHAVLLTHHGRTHVQPVHRLQEAPQVSASPLPTFPCPLMFGADPALTYTAVRKRRR